MTDFNSLLTGKVALITGAGSKLGFGSATARLFAQQGAQTALVDIDADGLADTLAELGDGHRAYTCDVSDRTACRDTVARVAADFGGLDILINNAGLVFGTPIDEIAAEEFERVVDVNLGGNFHMAQAAIPELRKRGGGAIVCISSIAGQNGGGVFGRSHYAASKAGIMGLAKALGRELAPEGIRVNAIAPGTVDNDFTKGRMTDEIKSEIAARVPMGRLGTPDEIAQACLFLASEMSSYVTGAVLDVNGGLHIH